MPKVVAPARKGKNVFQKVSMLVSQFKRARDTFLIYERRISGWLGNTET